MSGTAALATLLGVALLGGAGAGAVVRALLVRRARPAPSVPALVAVVAVTSIALVVVGYAGARAGVRDLRSADLLPVALALVLVWSTVTAAATDLLARLVPDPLTLGTLVAVLGLLGADVLVGRSARSLVLAVAVAGGLLLALAAPAVLHRARTGRSALGGGDRKFAPVVLLGLAALGPRAALVASVVASWSAGLHALVLVLAARRASDALGRTLPLAPHLAVGTIVGLLAG